MLKNYKNYGWGFYYGRWHVCAVLDGWIISVGLGATSKKPYFNFIKNWWRENKTHIERFNYA